MEKAFVTRQPIFDTNMLTFGYELIYKGSRSKNHDSSEEDKASATLLEKVIYTSFKDFVEDKHVFIGFSEKLLIDLMPRMLPKEKLFIEIRDIVPVTDDTIDACKKLKSMGYSLVLCDYNFGEKEKRYEPLMPYIDMIKISFTKSNILWQAQLIKDYSNKYVFIAEDVETTEAFQSALKLGYHLFQGFFFCEPVITADHDIGSLANNLTIVASALSAPEPDYKYIAKTIESDLDLSYKLLRMANSIYYATTRGITSILQAVVFIGTEELLNWSHLLMLKGIQNPQNAELVKTSLIRGKLLSLIAEETNNSKDRSDYFITGIFSSIDALLGESIEKVTEKLPLSTQVKDALTGKSNKIKEWLDAIYYFEKTQWEGLENTLSSNGITKQKFMDIYSKALKWCSEVNSMLC